MANRINHTYDKAVSITDYNPTSGVQYSEYATMEGKAHRITHANWGNVWIKRLRFTHLSDVSRKSIIRVYETDTDSEIDPTNPVFIKNIEIPAENIVSLTQVREIYIDEIDLWLKENHALWINTVDEFCDPVTVEVEYEIF